MKTDQSDFIIVGGGLCGCMVAHELIQRFGRSVTLIEPSAPAAKPVNRRPVEWIRQLGSSADWKHETLSSASLKGRSVSWPRGRGLGGSSRINAMIWIPPNDRDLCSLELAGGEDWSISRLRVAADRAEKLAQPEDPRWTSEVSSRFLKAAQTIPDARPMLYQRTNRGGRRWVASDLLDQLDNEEANRLKIVDGQVSDLLFRGDQACGVRIIPAGKANPSSHLELRATCGVILSAGAVANPGILFRSGIGGLETLDLIDTRCRSELPDVGKGLQDHLIFPVIYPIEKKNSLPIGWNPRDIARWNALGSGPLVSNLAECGGLFDDSQIQIHVTATHYLKYPQKNVPPAMTIGVNVTQPQSMGRITIDSTDPMVYPRIEPGYLNHPADLELTVRGIQLARQIAQISPLREILSAETLPGSRRSSFEHLSSSIQRYSQTLFHPTSTCAMGQVVDQHLRVKGASQLWISDASILPQVTLMNPTGTLLAVAVHAAELIDRQSFPEIRGEDSF